MSTLLIKSMHAQPISFRLQSPFITSKGQKAETHNILVTIVLTDGTVGYGEGSSSIAMPNETADAMQRVVRELIPELRSKPIDDYREILQTCWRRQMFHPTAVAAIECAVLDAYTRSRKQPLYKFLGGKVQTVQTDLTLSVGEPTTLFRQAKAAWKKGFRHLKVKLAGDSVARDMERLNAVHKAAPKAKLVADGNQCMQISQGVELARHIEKSRLPLVFLEQPFAKHDFRAMRQFRRQSKLSLFADESALSPADVHRLFEYEAADGINIKVAKCGLLAALDIIQIARRYKKRLAIGCMEESKLGLAASVHLACGAGVFEWIDLDSVFLLEPSSLRGGFTMSGPKLSVQGIRAGIGVA